MSNITKLLLAAAFAAAAFVPTAHASGWQEYYDCGNGVVPIISGWHGKMWLDVDENHKTVLESKKFFDGGIDTLDKPPKPLNADATHFRFRIKLKGRATILRFHRSENAYDKVTFADRSCRFMGTRYDDEVKKYNGED
jgi:hypothetical protein